MFDKRRTSDYIELFWPGSALFMDGQALELKKTMGKDINVMDKPEIEYPCDWTFKIIGRDEKLLREAAIATLQSRIHTVNNSNTSSGGKYTSLNLAVNVKDETDRNEIFANLQKNSAIKLIL